VVGMVAVVPANQRSLQDELPIVVHTDGVTAAVDVADAKDSRADTDKVVRLANLAASSPEVELVPATVHVEVLWAAGMLVVVVVAVMVVGADGAGLAGARSGG